MGIDQVRGTPNAFVRGHNGSIRAFPEPPSGMRWCRRCEQLKTLDDFFPYRSKGRNTYQGVCKSCNVDVAREWRAKNRLRSRYHSLKGRIFKKFGMTVPEYEALLEKQDHRCAICLGPERTTQNDLPILMSIDHDHATGRVRGLLCNACNRALGLLQDNIAVLTSAISYLRSHQDQG